jgi:uncharacterized membrane protein YfcA
LHSAGRSRRTPPSLLYTCRVPVAEVLTLVLVGLFAGGLGGLLGIGGSIVMIPALTLLFRHDQHESQAAAMIVNVFVSVPAVLRHQRARAVPWRVVSRMLPAGLVLILIGVEASNYLDGAMLMRIFGVFLIYVIFVNARKLVGGHASGDGVVEQIGWARMSTIGGITGFAAGLLGIGGGIIAVPLLQRITHLPLRRCIAASAATMCVTATIGAVRKNIALADLGLDPYESLRIAACIAPTAIIGGLLGATLTHVLPLRWIRIVLLILLSVAAAKFLGVF